MKALDAIAVGWLVVFSAMAFAAFGWDKWRAANSSRRVSESTLLLLAALGGWLGALLGMNVFRHKTAKWNFKLKFATALIPFALEIWAWLRWR